MRDVCQAAELRSARGSPPGVLEQLHLAHRAMTQSLTGRDWRRSSLRGVCTEKHVEGSSTKAPKNHSNERNVAARVTERRYWRECGFLTIHMHTMNIARLQIASTECSSSPCIVAVQLFEFLVRSKDCRHNYLLLGSPHVLRFLGLRTGLLYFGGHVLTV